MDDGALQMRISVYRGVQSIYNKLLGCFLQPDLFG